MTVYNSSDLLCPDFSEEEKPASESGRHSEKSPLEAEHADDAGEEGEEEERDDDGEDYDDDNLDGHDGSFVAQDAAVDPALSPSYGQS